MHVLLFLATSILWGSSAIVTAQQASAGAPEVSVAYRLVLASLVMFGWSLARGHGIALRKGDRLWVALQGVLFFGVSFISFYHATTLIPSGIAALVLSTSSLFAALAGWLFLSVPVTRRMLAGICVGLLGLAVIAAPQFALFSSGREAMAGLGLALSAAAGTGCGTVVAMRNQRTGIPIVVLMSWTALCGALFAFTLALAEGRSFSVDVSLAYLAGLAHLAIVASCVTFFMYFSLVQRIGAASASYTLALVPVVALVISALFEDLAIDALVVSGGVAVLAGNVLVLSAGQSRPAAAKSAG
ncbi:DMT family transporter [Breoghania sp.]|uniref:DMT family transporter n=1 Tax=Breoghania sp. TaxID=2065378 RepID=UPI002AAAFC6D|nr:DMT family transporter [Breoghania sp.]